MAGFDAGAEDLCEARREACERGLDDLDRLGPGKRARVADRRVLVGKLELVEAEETGLCLQPLARHRVRLLGRGHHRLDRLVVELVVHVRRLHRILVAAQAIDAEPVADERVVRSSEHVRSRASPS